MAVPNQNYIANEWVAGESEVENRNPSDISDVIGNYVQASKRQLEHALEAARSGQQIWQETGIERRYNALMAIGQEMIARSAELGELLSREEGKPRAEGIGEVHRAGQFFTYYAAEVLRQIGDNADSVRREPVGVVAVKPGVRIPGDGRKSAQRRARNKGLEVNPATLEKISRWL